MDLELQSKWNEVLEKLEGQFGPGMDLQSVIFLIGVQELGLGARNFSKKEKLDLMHIAICRLLSQYGYYEFDGYDNAGWPQWKSLEKLPNLQSKEQDQLIMQAVIDYFEEETL